MEFCRYVNEKQGTEVDKIRLCIDIFDDRAKCEILCGKINDSFLLFFFICI